MRRIVRMFVNDAFGAPRRVRDDMLPNGIERWRLEGTEPPRQKVLSLGSAVWNGSLRSVVDLELDRLERLVVSAGPTRKLIDEGRVWVGGLTGLLRTAGQDLGPGDMIDATEVLDAADDLLEKLGQAEGATRIGSEAAAISIKDAIGRVRSAAARVNDTRRSTRDALADFGRVSDEQRALGPKLNEQAREFYARQAAPASSRAIGDSTPSRVRDLVAQANKLPPSRERNDLLAAAGRAQWGG